MGENQHQNLAMSWTSDCTSETSRLLHHHHHIRDARMPGFHAARIPEDGRHARWARYEIGAELLLRRRVDGWRGGGPEDRQLGGPGEKRRHVYDGNTLKITDRACKQGINRG